MGIPLFGQNISGLIKQHVAPGLLDATLTVVTHTTYGDLTAAPSKTTVDHACKGFIDDNLGENLDETLAERGDKVVVLIGDTIDAGDTAPRTQDLIVIESTTYRIHRIDRDPAAATYACTSTPQ